MDQQKYIRTYLLGAEHKYFQRSALGQGHETYGEDPYLAGVLGTAFVKGMQGDGKYRKTDATLKHFAVHSGPEGIRHSFNSVVSEKDLRETYLWAFKYCIDNAEPAAVMGAYNRLNGEPCCGSKHCFRIFSVMSGGLTDILYQIAELFVIFIHITELQKMQLRVLRLL